MFARSWMGSSCDPQVNFLDYSSALDPSSRGWAESPRREPDAQQAAVISLLREESWEDTQDDCYPDGLHQNWSTWDASKQRRFKNKPNCWHAVKIKGDFFLRVSRLSVSLCENREGSVWVPADTDFQPREPIVQWGAAPRSADILLTRERRQQSQPTPCQPLDFSQVMAVKVHGNRTNNVTEIHHSMTRGRHATLSGTFSLVIHLPCAPRPPRLGRRQAWLRGRLSEFTSSWIMSIYCPWGNQHCVL